jgi:hypothetical protein
VMDAAKPGPGYDPNPSLRRKRVLDIGIGLVLGLVLTGIGTGGFAVLRPSPSKRSTRRRSCCGQTAFGVEGRLWMLRVGQW